MANLKKAAVIITTIYGNGTDTTFELDLLKDSYFVTQQGGSFTESPMNWFSENPATNPPTGVFVNPGDTATLNGFVIGYTYATAPAAGPNGLEIGLLF
jgi:hypothetical protein